MRDNGSDFAPACSATGAARTQAATENQHNNMQNYCKTIGALAAASALVAGNANAGTSAPAPVSAAPDSSISYELHTGYSSEYIFRGVNLGDDLVETGFDVATEAWGLGLSAGVWYANYQAPDFDGGPRGDSNVNEIDLYAEVSKDFGFATLSTGYIYYYNDVDQATSNFYGGNYPDTQEVYFSAARDFGFAKASLTYFWDIVGDNDGYSELGLSRSFELSPCVSLNASTNFGYLVEESDFTAWTTRASLDWGFVEHAKLSPFVQYSVALSDEPTTAYNNSENEFIGGAMLSVGF
jgi:hypothetical protein